MPDDEDVETDPPSPIMVAHRALCLGALIIRCDLERTVQVAQHPMVSTVVEGELAELDAWIEREGLIEHQSPRERNLFNKRLGTWNQQEIVDASWRQEALGILDWALRLLDEIPPYDTIVQTGDVVSPMPLHRPVAEFVAYARLRPHSEIAAARDDAELWHWRSRTVQVQKRGVQLPEGLTFQQIIYMSAMTMYEEGRLPPPIAGDFPVYGKAYADLTEEEYAEATSIAVERHFALNWLCGYSAAWDETPTDT